MRTGWVLHDRFYDDPEPGETVRVPISSADELRRELEALASLEPRIAELETPDGKWVRIGIGGLWAGLALVEDVILPGPGSPSEMRVQIALAPSPAVCEWVEFLCGRQPCTLDAANLFPVSQVVELVTHYFQTGQFPRHLQWSA